jgi:hydroxyacylglutathione hydrolase
MILRQYLDTEPTVAASYLLGCGSQEICAVVDPLEDIERYQEAADSLGMRIACVIDTHAHADHLSGGRRLAEASGAAYVLHESAGAAYPFHSVQEGDTLDLGNVQIHVWHTPGHTPEHISLLVTDKRRSPQPWFVLTGHTLMVGDLGRTELAGSPEEGARALFHSAQRLKALPDHIEVLPGAFSGSVCGRALSGKPTSTIGFERRFNRAFAMEDEEEFVRFMLSDIPPRPPHAEETRRKNLGR